MRRGLTAVREMKESQGSFNDNGLRFYIRGGETALIRIYGSFEDEQDPIIGTTHFVKRLPKGNQYHNCAMNVLADFDASTGAASPHAGCVFCHLKNGGDKGVNSQNRAYFFVQDFRKYHKLESEVRILRAGVKLRPGQQGKPDDYVNTKYPPCSAPKSPCMFCNQGGKSQITGFRYWELAVSYAEQLVSQQAELRTYCRCKGRSEEGIGTIYVTQYLCGHCQQPVEFYPEQGKPVANCRACRQTLPPLEEIACSACEAPQRCDLQDFYFRVTRTGDGTDTTYNFEAHQPCSPPSEKELEEAAAKKPDFDAITSPEPAEVQAAILAVQCPFETPGHGARPYGGGKPAPAAAPAVAPKGFKIPKLGKGEPAAPGADAAGQAGDDDIPY